MPPPFKQQSRLCQCVYVHTAVASPTTHDSNKRTTVVGELATTLPLPQLQCVLVLNARGGSSQKQTRRTPAIFLMLSIASYVH
jgi:hypothetical protein